MGWGRFLGLTAIGKTWWIHSWRSTSLAKLCVLHPATSIGHSITPVSNPTLDTEANYLMCYSFLHQVCTKILEKNANPQWNQSLSMPIRVRHTNNAGLAHTEMWLYCAVKMKILMFCAPPSFPPCVRRWGSESWTGEFLLIFNYFLH